MEIRDFPILFGVLKTSRIGYLYFYLIRMLCSVITEPMMAKVDILRVFKIQSLLSLMKN